MRDVTRAYRLQNIEYREDTFTLESIKDVIKHKRLWWLGHVCHTPRDNIVTQDIKAQQKRRQLKRWSDQIRNDSVLLVLTA